MDTLLAFAAPAAGCAVMMVLCARMMRRGDCTPASAADSDEVTRLRAEVAELRATLGTDRTDRTDRTDGTDTLATR